jgi:hypothetical protein
MTDQKGLITPNLCRYLDHQRWGNAELRIMKIPPRVKAILAANKKSSMRVECRTFPAMTTLKSKGEKASSAAPSPALATHQKPKKGNASIETPVANPGQLNLTSQNLRFMNPLPKRFWF